MPNNKQNRPRPKNGSQGQGKKQRPGKSGPTSEARRLAYNSVSRSLGMRMGQNLTQLMATPREAQVVRMPTPDMPLVALLKSDSVFNVNHSNISASGFDAGTVNYYLFGQVGRGLIYGPVLDTSPYDYRLKTNFGFDGGNIFPLKATNTGSQAGQDYTSTHTPDSCVSVFTSTAIGDKRPLGAKYGKNWLWMWAGERAEFSYKTSADSITWSTTFMGGTGTIQISSTDCGNEPNTWAATRVINTATTMSVTWDVVISGYYAFDYIWTAASAGTSLYVGYTTRIYNPGTVNAYPMLTLPQVSSAPEAVQKCRRTACSLLVTNTTAEINQQGNIIAARVKPDYVTLISKTELQGLADKYTGKAKNGCYTYMDFSQGAEKFEDCADNNTSLNTQSILYDLTWSEMVHVISVSSPNAATQANSYLVTMDAVVEFMTDKPIYSRGVSQGSFDQLIEARRINNMSPYFFENPLHMADITKRIGEFWSMMRRYATPIGVGLSAAFPQASPAIMPVARYLQT